MNNRQFISTVHKICETAIQNDCGFADAFAQIELLVITERIDADNPKSKCSECHLHGTFDWIYNKWNCRVEKCIKKNNK